MQFRYDIEQGSLEWFELKHGKIGGTRAKGLFIKSDTLLLELLAEHTEPFDEDAEDTFKSDAMERGTYLEPQARIELGKYSGIEFLECGFIESDDELLGISPDGISECETIQCEIKCLGAKNHLKLCLKDEIPNEFIPQLIHAFAVNSKLKKMYFCAYRPESIKQIFVKELNRNSLVNIGTEAKPVIKAIHELVLVIQRESKFLKEQIEISINKLKF
jgi:hypothetical protein